MNYNGLYKAFKAKFPEDQAFFKKMEEENLIDDTVGMHPTFGMVVVPYIIQNVQQKRIAEIERIFSFLEMMTYCDDSDIGGVLDFTVLERLADEGREFMTECKQYMGMRTLEHCREVEKYLL